MKNVLWSNVLKKWGTEKVKSTTVKWVKPLGYEVFHLINATRYSACGMHRLSDRDGHAESKRGFGEDIDLLGPGRVNGESYCPVCRRIERWLTGGK